ncbi:MAG TPA: hypothetical protein VFR24_06070 [Candidatus Angelobacter sp.]|nr:hypothetical protein [Candidatus Angelobacter sp.]
MSGDITVDLGSVLPYLSEKFLAWFGHDLATKQALEWFNELQRIGHLESASVQCIGMHMPVPIGDVYQTTRLIIGDVTPTGFPAGSQNEIEASEFMKAGGNAIIKAGPGYGKTTFLHYVYMTEMKKPGVLPILITLRRMSALRDLERLLELASSVDAKKWQKQRKLLLLVDGYDEISGANQKRVSELLLKFESTLLGNYLLTCRRFYDVYELQTRTVHIAPFNADDQLGFSTAFLKLYGAELSAEAILHELNSRRMSDFLAHPLLLALVCIVKSNPSNPLANSVLELAEIAIETLSFRWDLAKGVARQATTQLSGKNRVDMLAWLAFKINKLPVSRTQTRRLADQYLTKLRWSNINSTQALIETAKFYGIFVPYDTGWTFVHKVLQDFLAARYWVNSGTFNPQTVEKWDTRAAYAGCLQPDATNSMLHALRHFQTACFAEMLMNSPPFNHKQVAVAFLYALLNAGEDRKQITNSDIGYLGYADNKFLDSLLAAVIEAEIPLDNIITNYALLEIAARHAHLEKATYEMFLKQCPENTIFQGVHRGRWQTITLKKVAPLF